MKAPLIAALLLTTGTAAAQAPTPPADAPAQRPADDRALLLLGAIDVVLTPDNLAAVGVDEALATAVARDAAQRRYLRVRAAGALGVLGTVGARHTLEALAAADADVQVRIQAAISLARVWAPRDPAVAERLRALRDGAPPVLAEALADELTRLERTGTTAP